MEEDRGRLFSDHVVVDRDDVNLRNSQSLENSLELGSEHDEISVDDRLVLCPGERCPGVDPHRAADLVAVHANLPADRHPVDAILQVAPDSQDRRDVAESNRGRGSGLQVPVDDPGRMRLGETPSERDSELPGRVVKISRGSPSQEAA
jgi:hypothetical protein